jgi:hypothetical protein
VHLEKPINLAALLQAVRSVCSPGKAEDTPRELEY